MDKKILDPIINIFVDSLERIENEKLSEVKSLGRENEKARELQNRLNEQIKSNDNKAALDKKKIEDREGEIEEIKKTLNKEISTTNFLNQRKQDNLRKIEQEKKSQEEMSKAKSAELSIQRDLNRQTQDKLTLLKTDEDSNKNKALELNGRERKVELKERKCLNDERIIIDKQAKFDEDELDMRTKQKRINLEYKRLNL